MPPMFEARRKGPRTLGLREQRRWRGESVEDGGGGNRGREKWGFLMGENNCHIIRIHL